MLNLKTLTALTIAVLNTSIAIADTPTESQTKPYAGLSLAFASFTEEITLASDYETDHLLFGIRAGLQFNDYFSGEFRFGKGDEDATTWEGEFWKTKLDQYMGLYIKAHYPIDEQINVYGLLGKTKLKYSESYSYTDPDPLYSYSGSYSENEQDTTWAIGAEYKVENTNTPISVGVEYISYYDKQDVSIDGLSFSILFLL